MNDNEEGLLTTISIETFEAIANLLYIKNLEEKDSKAAEQIILSSLKYACSLVRDIALAQEHHWTVERMRRGNYKVSTAISECRRVSQAIDKFIEEN